MDYLNPISPIIESPVNLDRIIQDLQLDLKDRLTWLNLSFGRAYRARRINPKTGKPHFYPEVFKSTDSHNRYIEVSPNDAHGTFSFFYVPDFVDHKEVTDPIFPTNNLKTKVNLIFWGNLQKITQAIKYRFTELLKQDIRFILRSHTDFVISKEYEEPDRVFKDFDINEIENQYFRSPYFGLRFELLLTYLPDCKNELNTY